MANKRSENYVEPKHRAQALRMKEARKELGLSVEELSVRMGLKNHRVRDLEYGNLKFTPTVLRALRYEGVHPFWIATGNGSKWVQPSPYDGLEGSQIIDVCLSLLKLAPSEEDKDKAIEVIRIVMKAESTMAEESQGHLL